MNLLQTFNQFLLCDFPPPKNLWINVTYCIYSHWTLLQGKLLRGRTQTQSNLPCIRRLNQSYYYMKEWRKLGTGPSEYQMPAQFFFLIFFLTNLLCQEFENN